MSETWNESSTSVGSTSPRKEIGWSISSLVVQLEELLECDCSNAVDERDITIPDTPASNNAALRDACPLSEVTVSSAQDRTLSPTPSTAKRESPASGQLFDVPLTPVGTTTATITASPDTKPETGADLALSPVSRVVPTATIDGDSQRNEPYATTELAIIETVGSDCNHELARSVDATAAAIEEFITPVPDCALEKNPRVKQQAKSQETAIARPSLSMIDLLTTCPGSPLPELPSPTIALTETTKAIESSLEASLHSFNATGDAIVDEMMEKDVVGESLHRLDELLTPVPDDEIPEVPPSFVSLESFAAVPIEKDLILPTLEVESVPESVSVPEPKPASRDLPLTDESFSNSLIEVLPKSTGNDNPLRDESFSNSVIEDHQSKASSSSHHDTNAADDTSDLFEDVENSPCGNEASDAHATAASALSLMSDPVEQREDTEESSAIRSLAVDNENEGADIPPEKAPLPQPDYEIADFDRRKILGEGQFGQVWLVVEKKTKSPFALKMLSKYDMVVDDLIGNLVRETGIMKKMHGHPFIAQLVSTFQDDQLVYLLEEFCQGGELFSVMHDLKKFTPYEASFYTNCLARALSDLHESNIVYRDLKPENIVLDVLGYPKLIDFGYAKELESGERTNTFCGTPRYLAPEIVAGVGHSFAVDDWALGVLIYEFLTGENPFFFEGMDEPGLFDSIQHDDFAQPEIEDKDAMDLISRLLVKDPRKRLSTSEIVDHAWLKQWDFQNDILSCKVKAPWLPTVQNRWDTNCFDNWSGLLEDRTLQQFPELSTAEAAKFAPLLL